MICGENVQDSESQSLIFPIWSTSSLDSYPFSRQLNGTVMKLAPFVVICTSMGVDLMYSPPCYCSKPYDQHASCLAIPFYFGGMGSVTASNRLEAAPFCEKILYQAGITREIVSCLSSVPRDTEAVYDTYIILICAQMHQRCLIIPVDIPCTSVLLVYLSP